MYVRVSQTHNIILIILQIKVTSFWPIRHVYITYISCQKLSDINAFKWSASTCLTIQYLRYYTNCRQKLHQSCPSLYDKQELMHKLSLKSTYIVDNVSIIIIIIIIVIIIITELLWRLLQSMHNNRYKSTPDRIT